MHSSCPKVSSGLSSAGFCTLSSLQILLTLPFSLGNLHRHQHDIQPLAGCYCQCIDSPIPCKIFWAASNSSASVSDICIQQCKQILFFKLLHKCPAILNHCWLFVSIHIVSCLSCQGFESEVLRPSIHSCWAATDKPISFECLCCCFIILILTHSSS